MRGDFDDLWKEREEMINIEEKDDPFCTCEDYGEDACPIHSQVDLDIIPNTYVEELTIVKHVTKTKKGLSKTIKKVK